MSGASLGEAFLGQIGAQRSHLRLAENERKWILEAESRIHQESPDRRPSIDSTDHSGSRKGAVLNWYRLTTLE